MRYLLLSYFTIFLVMSALFILFSFNTNFGYVFLQWQGWQIQTNLLVLLIFFFISIGVFYLIWQLLKYLLRRYLQKYQMPKSFNALHPYERLGILWLLHAERTEQNHINQTYQRSYILYPLIQTRLALAQKDTVNAKKWIKSQNNPLFELAELLKIDIAMLEQDPDLALNRLEFLTVQPLSSWLIPIENTYHIELQSKWMMFAESYPWQLLKTVQHPIFTHEQQQVWLKSLIKKTRFATVEDWQLFENWYKKNYQLIQLYDFDLQADVLKLMSHHTYFDDQIIGLAENLLMKHFIPKVLYIWLGKQMKLAEPNLADMQSKIMDWQQKYSAQPSLTFAEWHLSHRLNQTERAAKLLDLYPHDPYMAYLRLQNQHNISEQTLNDLKLMFEYSKQDFSLEL